MNSPRWAYVALLAWIPAWLFLNPAGLTWGTGIFAAIAIVPLFFPLRGVLKRSNRAEIWGAYASLPAFLIGVMESWSNPAQRLGALTQALLVAAYWILVMAKARRHRQPAE